MAPRAFAVAAALLAGCVSAASISAADPAYVEPLGRAIPGADGSLTLSWLGGGLAVAHTGTVLRATFNTTSSGGSPNIRLALYRDGIQGGNDPWQGVALVPQTGGAESVVVGLGAGAVHFTTNTPADYWPGGAPIVVSTLESDGAFVPRAAPPPARRVLHVLGDSITAATNVRGGFRSCADGGYYADYSSSWAGLVCAFFGASCSTVAVGGKGLVKNCCDAGTTVPQFYTQAVKNAPDGSFDFKDARPDGVLVYLGTNDYSHGPSAALDASFTAAWLELMANVTTRYYGTPAAPAADIQFFAVLGPMSPTLPANATLAAVAEGQARGFKVSFINATQACGGHPCVDGCASHPGVGSREARAGERGARVRSLP